MNEPAETVTYPISKHNTISQKDVKRFFDKVNKTDTCWLWVASWLGDEYGGFWLNGKMQKSNRVSYMIHYGRIPNEKPFVLHNCDVRLCVRPEHLWAGTHDDNMDDKVSKGRCSRGENHGAAKLNDKQVEQIRKIYSSGEISQRKLASKFYVTQALIHGIIARKIWTHI